jgi:hypothetical protein
MKNAEGKNLRSYPSSFEILCSTFDIHWFHRFGCLLAGKVLKYRYAPCFQRTMIALEGKPGKSKNRDLSLETD